MCALTQTTDRSWRRIFLLAEAFVILSCGYGLTLRILWRYDAGQSAYRVLSPLLRSMSFCFLAVSVFLLVVSPFFLPSLRSVALRAWIIGAAALICAGCLFYF